MYLKTPCVLSVALWTLVGCGDGSRDNSPKKHYDAKRLMQQKCAACHNLEMPPKTSDEEKAPPLYTITVHLKDWIKSDTDEEKRQKFIAFLQRYIPHPSREISYCDAKSLETYGLMPAMEGNITKGEIAAIATYAFSTYDQMAMLAINKERNRIAALPPYQQVLETRDCKFCHIHGNGKVAPTFAQIGAKYGSAGIEQIKRSILEGSKGKWKAFRSPMKSYKNLTPQQLDGIASWIAKQR